MTKTVYILGNGILTIPGSSKNWNGKGVTWIHTQSDGRVCAEKIEYLIGPISRFFGQKKRAKRLARTIQFYAGWDIVLAGHSNYADVMTDAIRDFELPPIKAMHIISGACHRDFEKNGLNASGIKEIHVYIAKRDKALKLANLKPARWIGYGALGLLGPERNTMPVNVVTRDWGHSDWFKKESFDATMKLITNPS